ncbi:MAG: tRNA uridine-5-carboxymethylaminomethyl(34) synthesis GTPase MnmE [Desulfobulbus propionicus]|nr:MAG: tRNA uridine-5-carboxymethylaminomethyl(34) synthesis GTPase MnmE [Desulfobulbus propionicus]PIE63766.1 MAG: tRNA uridine-5-carboxymethylaminomethyl(34) synthesis GTPase MnmE [Desulfobacterales bacterium]
MAPRHSTDTIAAIATPPGTGGIGIIRISGSAALAVLKQLFFPKAGISQFESHKLYYGTLKDAEGQPLDEILAVYMQAPHTYTVEDVVELHCHGSYVLLQKVLQTVFSCGVRSADPGEFTKRAFLGGRIDLTQAEAVIELLNAQTEKGAKLAVHQLQGLLSTELEPVRKSLVAILAVLEVAIDFPEDDVELIDPVKMKEQLLGEILQPVQRLIGLGAQGKIIREGISAVIAGRPNVGKSSLLNALLNEERALVTSLPGTTRDTIEETISIAGIPIHLIDTAGIRAHSDVVEELGMERARQKLGEADLVLFLVDASQNLTSRDKELYETIEGKNHIVVINKIDSAPVEMVATVRSSFSGSPVVEISAKQGKGIDALQKAVFQAIITDEQADEVGLCAPNIRHLTALKKTQDACEGLLRALEEGAPADLLAVETQAALDYLSDIVGITTPEDVLDAIFEEFCIGK